MEKYRLQKYEDGTYGYYKIDGNEKYNLTTESPVICTQGEDEDREEFIRKNDITFTKNQYGSNEKLDKLVNSSDYRMRKEVADVNYGLEKLINDEDEEVRAAVARQGYALDKLYNDSSYEVRKGVKWYLIMNELTLARWLHQNT